MFKMVRSSIPASSINHYLPWFIVNSVISSEQRRKIRKDFAVYQRFLNDVACLCWIAIIAVAAGCSRSSPATYAVTGIVKQASGAPLAGGHILFQPTGDATQPARGTIAADGAFQLGTFTPGDGAVPGVHKVAIYPLVPEDALGDAAAIARHRSVIDSRYQNVQTTPLELTVKGDGSANHFEIVLESAGGKQKKNLADK